MAKRFHAIISQAAHPPEASAKASGTAPGQLQTRMRRAGLRFYADCEFSMYTKRQRQLESNADTGLGELQLWLSMTCSQNLASFPSQERPTFAP